ncbi:hypothetical protein EV702DRAFT_1128737 [Suillus placidus]|uniref:Uncharacterized protein n=1 Tax=Suillus placidus TaxID=48579 RepID=A0A9P7CZU1_9AGAM|nr:hypothetical protein EV702DRAFT_1128737 [Suillus placidus]
MASISQKSPYPCPREPSAVLSVRNVGAHEIFIKEGYRAQLWSITKSPQTIPCATPFCHYAAWTYSIFFTPSQTLSQNHYLPFLLTRTVHLGTPTPIASFPDRYCTLAMQRCYLFVAHIIPMLYVLQTSHSFHLNRLASPLRHSVTLSSLERYTCFILPWTSPSQTPSVFFSFFLWLFNNWSFVCCMMRSCQVRPKYCRAGSSSLIKGSAHPYSLVLVVIHTYCTRYPYVGYTSLAQSTKLKLYVNLMMTSAG